MTFKKLGLSDALLKAVADKNYTTPSPIQEKSIPPILKGLDILASAQTGTGKTAGFAMPVIQLLSMENRSSNIPIQALILTPTRELAAQVLEDVQDYSKYLDIRSTVVFGGVNQKPQVAKLQKGIDILVATPGRLMDLHNQGFISLRKIQFKDNKFISEQIIFQGNIGRIRDIKIQKETGELYMLSDNGELWRLYK